MANGLDSTGLLRIQPLIYYPAGPPCGQPNRKPIQGHLLANLLSGSVYISCSMA